jgi:hypothetical protein
MRKILFVLSIFLLSNAAFSASGFTYFWTIADGDTVTKTKWKANNDTVLNWSSRVGGDTMNTKVWWANAGHDSTYWRVARNTKIKVDSTVTGDSINARAIKATNLSTDSLISTVKSFPCSLFDGATYRAKVTATYKSIAGIVSITIPNLIGSFAGGGPCYIRTIPAEIRPAATKQVICIVVDNGTLKAGMIFPANNAQFTVSDIPGTGCVSGTSGIAGTTCVIYNLY